MKSELLTNLKTSKINIIEVMYGDEKIAINISDELYISEKRLTEQLKTQPSIYGFLTTLNANLIKHVALLEIDMEKSYAHAYLTEKDRINPKTQRPNSDDVAKAKADINAIYIKMNKKFIEAKREQQVIASLVKAFEQRAGILQTLSANERSQKF